ncbi:MAG: EAL domain-containing protein [Alphaproteobacteria bacterium]|nr:EAL domain-containing protein [Alphaproteobacteria bacterium]
MAEKHDKELLSRIESLLTVYRRFVEDGEGTPQEESLVYGLRGLVNVANMILRNKIMFTMEPWHAIGPKPSLSRAGEMLLRLKDYQNEPMPPYPFIMAFYSNGFVPQLDTILVLAALRRVEMDDRFRQVSINISAKSLRDADFVKVVLGRLEEMELLYHPEHKIIFEIHESSVELAMSRKVLELFRSVGVGFAIDDVGMSMDDVMRLSEFEGIADYIKIDRHCVLGMPEDPNNLVNVMSFIRTMLPETVVIAEGVQSAEHAQTIMRDHPDIDYVQGLYLPTSRRSFQTDFYNAGLGYKQGIA